MKHILLTRLDSEIRQLTEGLEKPQALTLAGLSICRLWHPFEKWALQNKMPKLAEWGTVCVDTLWGQIALGRIFGLEADFERYYKALDQMDGKLERLEEKGVAVEGSAAYPLVEALDSALCCFFDPKLLPGLQRHMFWTDIIAIVGQGLEYIYDDIFSNAGEISEDDLISLVTSDPRWTAERRRIEDDISFFKEDPQDQLTVLKRKEDYLHLDIFM